MLNEWNEKNLIFLINWSFLVEGIMMWVHDLQKPLDVRLLLGNGEVVNAEVVLLSLKFSFIFTILSKVGLFSIIAASQHLQTTELVMAPKKAETASHWRGALTGFLKKALFETRPK